jgi:hypothetical protein
LISVNTQINQLLACLAGAFGTLAIGELAIKLHQLLVHPGIEVAKWYFIIGIPILVGTGAIAHYAKNAKAKKAKTE